MFGLCLGSLLRIARRPGAAPRHRHARDAAGPRPTAADTAWLERLRQRSIAVIQSARGAGGAGRHSEVLFASGVFLGFAVAAASNAVLAQFTPLTPPISLFFTLFFAIAGGLFCARVLPRIDGVKELPSEEELLIGANRAVRDAIARLHHANIATTHYIDGKLVRVLPDGRREGVSPSSPPG